MLHDNSMFFYNGKLKKFFEVFFWLNWRKKPKAIIVEILLRGEGHVKRIWWYCWFFVVSVQLGRNPLVRDGTSSLPSLPLDPLSHLLQNSGVTLSLPLDLATCKHLAFICLSLFHCLVLFHPERHQQSMSVYLNSLSI